MLAVLPVASHLESARRVSNPWTPSDPPVPSIGRQRDGPGPIDLSALKFHKTLGHKWKDEHRLTGNGIVLFEDFWPLVADLHPRSYARPSSLDGAIGH